MYTPATVVDDAFTPTQARRCRFTNFQKYLLAPFVVCADFESILKRVDDDEAILHRVLQWVVVNRHLEPS